MQPSMQSFPHIPQPSRRTEQEAWRRVNRLTKPVGSLGRLEQLAVRLAGITGEVVPDISRKAVVVMCGDHGVVEEGVSAYPQEVTGLMIRNFAAGKAAANVLARLSGAQVVVVDVGSLLDPVPEGVVDRKIRKGTRNFTVSPAMTEEEAWKAIQAGIDVAIELASQGVRLLAIGEMGIGNTTAATAAASVLLGKPARELAGRGTGISDEGLARKIEVIERGLSFHRPDPSRPLEVLSRVGGLEIAGMAGCCIGAAARGMGVVVDGLISTVSALLAVRLKPEVRPYLFASHLSAEPAHRLLLEELELVPLIRAEMRLGEASGALLSFPLFDAAAALVREMATFADLGLPDPEHSEYQPDVK
jgi:nicotinate-nucleotide--dimethylbenzimidazole phosphoribosyltransferase